MMVKVLVFITNGNIDILTVTYNTAYNSAHSY